MSKKSLNQNSKYIQKFIDIIEPYFVFNNKPINFRNFKFFRILMSSLQLRKSLAKERAALTLNHEHSVERAR